MAIARCASAFQKIRPGLLYAGAIAPTSAAFHFLYASHTCVRVLARLCACVCAVSCVCFRIAFFLRCAFRRRARSLHAAFAFSLFLLYSFVSVSAADCHHSRCVDCESEAVCVYVLCTLLIVCGLSQKVPCSVSLFPSASFPLECAAYFFTFLASRFTRTLYVCLRQSIFRSFLLLNTCSNSEHRVNPTFEKISTFFLVKTRGTAK